MGIVVHLMDLITTFSLNFYHLNLSSSSSKFIVKKQQESKLKLGIEANS